MARDAAWQAKRDEAKLLGRVLAKLEHNFSDHGRADEATLSWEVQQLDKCAREALRLLGDDTLVSPMILGLQAAALNAERGSETLSFDSAYRYVGPILAAIEANWEFSGATGAPLVLQISRRQRVVKRIDEDPK